MPEYIEEKCCQLILYNKLVLWLDDREKKGGNHLIHPLFSDRISYNQERDYNKELYAWKN